MTRSTVAAFRAPELETGREWEKKHPCPCFPAEMSNIQAGSLPLPPAPPAPLLDRLTNYVQANKRVILIGAAVSTSAVIVAGASYYYLKSAGPPRSGGSDDGAEKKKRSKSKGKAKKPTDKLVDAKEDRQSHPLPHHFIPLPPTARIRSFPTESAHFPSNHQRLLGNASSSLLPAPIPQQSIPHSQDYR